jgi:hypothetical protein
MVYNAANDPIAEPYESLQLLGKPYKFNLSKEA